MPLTLEVIVALNDLKSPAYARSAHPYLQENQMQTKQHQQTLRILRTSALIKSTA